MRPLLVSFTIALAIVASPLHAQEDQPPTTEEPLGARDWTAKPATEDQIDYVVGGLQEQLPAPELGQQIRLRTDPEINIFDQIQVELLDLDQIRSEIRNRLMGPQIRLSIAECIRLALENNDDILIASYDPLIADSDIMAARGDFDPEFFGNVQHTDQRQPANPQTQLFTQGQVTSIESRNTDYQLGLRGFALTGTQYQIDYTLNRETGTFTTFEFPPGSGMFSRESEYAAGLTATLTQSFLRGFGIAVNAVTIRSAKNSRGIAEADLELAVLTTVGEVIKAYWDLVGAIETLRVRQEALANALRLVEINEQRLEIGTAAAIDVLQAKAGAAARQSDLVIARTAILDNEDFLKRLIGLQDGELFSKRTIVPVERPGVLTYDWDDRRSMRYAIENRPEIRIAQLQIRNAELEQTRARNGLLPQVDGSFSYGQNARSFMLDEAIDGVRDRDGRTWSVGLEASIPIGNRAARGAARRARLTLRQLEQQLAAVKQDLQLNVRLALRSVISSEVLVETNKQTRVLQEANVAAEERRLRLGVSTSQDVLDVQEDLTEAQVAEVQSQIDFEKSLVDLHVNEGTLLRRMGIVFDVREPLAHDPLEP